MLAMSAADGYCNDTVQVLDDLTLHTKDPEEALWAQSQIVSIGYSAITNATGPNDAGALLDMMVYSTLKRCAMEDHWEPDLLHAQGPAVVEGFRRAEEQVWADAAKGLPPAQLEQMRVLIEQWRKTHPGQYYVADVRFTDFEVVHRNEPQVKLPSSILGLLYLDPLAGLDPVAAEIKSYRDLTERMMFAAVRLPRLVGRQVNLQVRYALRDPQILSLVSSTDRFSNATSRFSETVSNMPEDLRDNTKQALAEAFKGISAERQAAIDQANSAISSQRDAIMKELDARESRLSGMLDQVNTIVANADRAGQSINAATTQTVQVTQQATQQALDHAYTLVLRLILVLLIGIPLVLIVYRFANGAIGTRGAHRPPRLSEEASGRPE
jgi:hypothetical protein